MQIIKYNKSQFKGSFYVSLLWFLFVLINLFVTPDLHWKDFLYVILGVIYILIFFFDTEKNYVIINEENIVVKCILNRKIRLDQINDISYEMNFIVISTNRTTVKINLNLIQKDDLDIAMHLNCYK